MMKTFGFLLTAFTGALVALPAAADQYSRSINPFETGFIAGSTANRATKPNILGKKGIGRLNSPGKVNTGPFNSRTARIAFTPLNGNFAARKAEFNGYLKKNFQGNRLKIVGLDQNPTHVIKGQLTYVGTASGSVVFHRWKLLDSDGRKLKTFVDKERGNRFNSRRPEFGIGVIELKKVSKTTADRLKFYLDGGAS